MRGASSQTVIQCRPIRCGSSPVVSSQWRPCFRLAGVSEQDCERLAGAFVYSGLLK